MCTRVAIHWPGAARPAWEGEAAGQTAPCLGLRDLSCFPADGSEPLISLFYKTYNNLPGGNESLTPLSPVASPFPTHLQSPRLFGPAVL